MIQGFERNEVIEMKKILSIIIVGLFVLMGSAVSLQTGRNVSASLFCVKNTPY